MRMIKAFMLVAAATLVTTGVSHGQTNLDLLRNVQTTGTSFDDQFIDQTGPKAEQLKQHLERIKMPAGFSISLYAVVPDARHMAVGPQGTVLWVGTRKVNVYTVVDRDKDRFADEGG